MVVGAAELMPGNWYVLFLDRIDLLGARNVLAVHDHSQGVFDLKIAGDGLRAVSQAHEVDLIPDAGGENEPVGGPQGLPFTSMIERVRELAGRESRYEVQP